MTTSPNPAPQRKAYRVALLCGAIPLVVGVSIFLLWLLTRWGWLMTAGIFTLYGGVAFFLVGVVALGRFCWLALRTPGLPRRPLWLSTVGCAALLLSNFPVAGGIAATAIRIETRYTVTVHNTSPQPLSGVRVFGGGCEADFGAFAPGGVVRRSFWIEREGELKFQAGSGAATQATTIDGYVIPSVGGHVTVTIKPDGTISVVGPPGA
ncbi:MAG: hypothetical protein ABJF10_17735 [Chthoniobacter sp.]|uniref:hypothetical protein n=1 Tax=Chthoniobacter sp. TaxID=2510640 RepID=UPI0032AB3E24